MSSDIVIEIFGKVSDPAKISQLAAAASEEGTIDWESGFGDDEFLELLQEAEKENRALVLTRKETGNLFDSVTVACQEAGLSYVANYGHSGMDGFTNGFSWSPGMDDEKHFVVSGEDPSVKLSDVRKALSGGLDNLTAFLDNIDSASRVGKIEIEPGFIEAYEAFEEAGPNGP